MRKRKQPAELPGKTRWRGVPVQRQREAVKTQAARTTSRPHDTSGAVTARGVRRVVARAYLRLISKPTSTPTPAAIPIDAHGCSCT
jgi:hypothetical protein